MKQLTIAAVIATLATNASAALTPIFEFSFPASFDATGNATVVDQSTAGNDFTTFNANAGYSATNVPSGMPAGSYGGGSGHGTIGTIGLLNSAAVTAAGGFTMDTWFYWPGNYSDTRKLIDYAGTENLRTLNSKIQFGLSNSAFVLESDILQDKWYHVIAQFETDGGTTTVGGLSAITGTARLWLDSGSGLTLVDTDTNAAKSTFGDDLNRGIGLNKHPEGGNWNQGSIYQPALYFGVEAIPEPSATVILGFTGLALVLRRRRK